MKQVKLATPNKIAAEIPDGATIAITGSGTLLLADAIFEEIERRFLTKGHPKNLTLVHALGVGDGKDRGINRFAHEGMVKRVIGGHWSWSPTMQELARTGKIEAYTFPGGVISTLFREVGAGRPGVITKVGLGTFVDPKISGGKCNSISTENLVDRITLDGETYLHYKPIKIDVAIIRGTVADAEGNLTTSEEPTDLDVLAVALAGRNSGGKVYAQVKSIVDTPIVPARMVTVPGTLIESVCVNANQRQSDDSDYDPAISGEAVPTPKSDAQSVAGDGVKAVIARRAARELKPGMTVNYGFGIPSLVSEMADPDVVSQCSELVEQGLYGGERLDGHMFGAARYPRAIISSLQQFDFFSGGGLDIAFLGMGELDKQGNVNVSMLGPSVVGPGGFMEIATGAHSLVFCGTFEARGLNVIIEDNELCIRNPGTIPKIVDKARHTTFNGAQALKNGQTVLYVTERCVFRLTKDGILLDEVAPGVNIQADIIERMAFKPLVNNPKQMPLD